jgi:hypothetical protein
VVVVAAATAAAVDGRTMDLMASNLVVICN